MRVCAEIAAALSAAHTEGLVHRDIKPANVMLAPTGAKVVDFGIAAAIRPPDPGGDDFEVLGTPAYLAPERLLHDAVQPASDVYALGVLLYRLLAGQSPWTSETTTQMLTAHVYVEPAPLLPMSQVPDYVTALCNRCLDKDPTQRPSAREAAALLAHGAGLQVVTDEPPAREKAAIDPSPSVLIRAPARPARLRRKLPHLLSAVAIAAGRRCGRSRTASRPMPRLRRGGSRRARHACGTRTRRCAAGGCRTGSRAVRPRLRRCAAGERQTEPKGVRAGRGGRTRGRRRDAVAPASGAPESGSVGARAWRGPGPHGQPDRGESADRARQRRRPPRPGPPA